MNTEILTNIELYGNVKYIVENFTPDDSVRFNNIILKKFYNELINKKLYLFINIELDPVKELASSSNKKMKSSRTHVRYNLTLKNTTFPVLIDINDVDSIKKFLSEYKAINVSPESQIIMSNSEFTKFKTACSKFNETESKIIFEEDNVVINPIIILDESILGGNIIKSKKVLSRKIRIDSHKKRYIKYNSNTYYITGKPKIKKIGNIKINLIY